MPGSNLNMFLSRYPRISTRYCERSDVMFGSRSQFTRTLLIGWELQIFGMAHTDLGGLD